MRFTSNAPIMLRLILGLKKFMRCCFRLCAENNASELPRIGMHRREHILILRPREDCLVAHTMFRANEVRPSPDLKFGSEFSDKEISMATALVKGYAGEFDPTRFKDIYQERIRKIIDAKVSNKMGMSPTHTRKIAPDLMEQIRLSLAQIESESSYAKSSKKSTRKNVSAAKKKPQRIPA